MKKSVIRNYARLIARTGVNIKKGDRVIINAELDQPEFIEILVKECYLAGAIEVDVRWTHQPLTKLHVKYRPLKVLTEVPEWEIAKARARIKDNPAVIHIISDDPDGLNGINHEKLAKQRLARYKALKPTLDELDNKYKWCIAAVPGKKWAKRVFPDISTPKAVELLWEAILRTSRAYEGNPEENWDVHNKSFISRADYLNSLGITELRYSSSNGTDFRVGLIPDAQFLGGGEYTLGGEFYNPNIPTEEIFITPMRGKAEGIVYSTKPLSYRGVLIENFDIRFENGKAVECHAQKNEEVLKQLINMDEGSCYLGECALVPYDSPINQTGLLFYNTLFDENACCHLALGEGFTNCIKDYDKYTLDELHAKGINDSMVHEDFMIGSPDLKVTAICKDGTEKLIFDGVWKI